jgi:hypothetical protein
MKKLIVNTAALAVLGCGPAAVQAQDLYAGLGLPNIYTLGYAHPVSQSWGLRGEYAGGTSASTNGTDNGVSYDATFKSSRAGVFADWFAFGGGFRFVGGVTANDTKLDLNAIGSGTATINGKTVNMAGNYFNVRLKYPTVTPYLGVGYGHHKADKGLGFYFDAGVTFGSFTAEVQTNVVGQNGITQADVDAQKQKMNDSLAGYKVMPSVSVGMVYRF